MTKAEIDAVLDRVKTWPPERQEEAMHVLLAMEEASSDHELSKEDIAAIEEGIAQARRGEFATDEEVAALFDRYRRP
jgi:predicted transcriptional regulator